MEESKYYTPEVEEFHIGFEYVIKVTHPEHEDCSTYQHFIQNTTYCYHLDVKVTSHNFKPGIGVLNIYSVPDTLKVKYLDKEDIESLGWKMGLVRIGNNELDCYGLENYVITTSEKGYNNTHKIDISIMKPIGQGIDRVFRGVIKNKSELKKLMKQLNINE